MKADCGATLGAICSECRRKRKRGASITRKNFHKKCARQWAGILANNCGWRWWLQSFYRLIPTAVNGFLTPFALKVVIRYVQADPRPGPIPRGVLVRAETENPGEARPEYVFKVLSLAQNEVFSAHAFLETTECSSLRMSGTDLSRRIRSLSTTRRTYPERFVFRAGDGVAALERSIGRELATLGDIGLPEAARAGALCRLLPLETASGRPRTFPFFFLLRTLEASISVGCPPIRLVLGPSIIAARVREIWTHESLASTRTTSC